MTNEETLYEAIRQQVIAHAGYCGPYVPPKGSRAVAPEQTPRGNWFGGWACFASVEAAQRECNAIAAAEAALPRLVAVAERLGAIAAERPELQHTYATVAAGDAWTAVATAAKRAYGYMYAPTVVADPIAAEAFVERFATEPRRHDQWAGVVFIG